jgi:hypothetical protein
MSTAERRPRAIWLGFLLVLIIAAGLRLWRIDSLPPGFHFDESFEGLEAWRILTDPAYRPIFLTGNFGVPPANAYANAFTFWLFERFGGEAGPTAMRTTAAVFGILGVAAVFALADELRRFDRRRVTALLPLLAAAGLAVMRWHLHFSRMGIEPVIVPLLWASVTWLFLRGWRTGSRLAYVASGVLLAAAMYTYQAAWILPFLMIPLAFILWLDQRRTALAQSTGELRRARLWGTVLTALTAFILFLPLGLFFLENQALVLMRPTQVAIVGETGSPADAGVWPNVVATAKMFGPLGMPGDMDPRRNIPGAPALNLWLALPFYFGLILALVRVGNPAYSIPLLGLVGLLVPGIFTEYAPHFHRILGAAGPTAVLIGLGLNEIWRWGQARPEWLKEWAQITAGVSVALLLTLGAMGSARDYFVRWASMPDLFYAFDAGFWEVGRAVAALPAGEPVYITPRGSEHTTLAFAWRDRLGTPDEPIAFDGRHIFPMTAGAAPQPEHYAVIEHEDFRTPLLLPEALPAATVAQLVTDGQGGDYARLYARPAGSEAARPPQVTLDEAIGDGIRLVGYDVQPATLQPGGILYLQLHWLTDAVPASDWTVFTHLVDPASDALMAGRDGPPGNGSLPTTRWQPGWRVLDEYQIALPADLPPGEYLMRAGLYQPDGTQLLPGGVVLGNVTVQP